jgi:hypothetical protein
VESTDESPGSLISIVIDDFDVQYNSIGVCFQGFYFDIACAVFGPFSVERSLQMHPLYAELHRAVPP